MGVAITRESPESLTEYARIPIAFEVRHVLDVESPRDQAGFRVSERDVTSYMKDYDALDGGPLSWRSRFDVSQWGFFIARDGAQPIGAATCVFRAPDMHMLDGRDDVSLLWDIRVVPALRGQGVGSALLSEAERWSVERGAMWLEVETQDVNVPACRFYAHHGFELREVNRHAYPELPSESQLLWFKRLRS